MIPQILIGAALGAIAGNVAGRVVEKRKERNEVAIREEHRGYRPYISPKSHDWAEFCRDHPRVAAAVLDEYADRKARAEAEVYAFAMRKMAHFI